MSAIVRSPCAAVNVATQRTLYKQTAQGASVTDYQAYSKYALALPGPVAQLDRTLSGLISAGPSRATCTALSELRVLSPDSRAESEKPRQVMASEIEAFMIAEDDVFGRGGGVPRDAFRRAPGGWYYLCRSRELRRGPVGIDFDQLKFVGFRDSARRIAVLSAQCAHMGADLANGRVVEGRLCCPLHGWEYSSDGS